MGGELGTGYADRDGGPSNIGGNMLFSAAMPLQDPIWPALVLIVLAGAAIALLAASVLALRSLAQRARELESESRRTRQDLATVGERLDASLGAASAAASAASREAIEAAASRAPAPPTIERAEIDLSRTERLLGEIRDRLGELDARLAAFAEEAVRTREVTLVPPAPACLGERVTNRLLALGYERVQIVTDSDVLDGIGPGDGEVLVEVHRQGVLHKGSVRVRDGSVADVDVHPTYSIFP